MTTELLNKLGSVAPDNLIAGTEPALRIGSGHLKADSSAELTVKRGTVLAKSSEDGKLVALGTTPGGGETLEPYGVLADDITLPADEDVNVPIYIGGRFNLNSIITANSYTMTEADKDTLRKYNIEFTAADTMLKEE